MATTATVCQRPVSAAAPSESDDQQRADDLGGARRGTAPAAIGRKRFVGCSRSASTSRASFQKYTPLAARQKATNASQRRRQVAGVVEHAGGAGRGEHEDVLHPLLRARRAHQPVHQRRVDDLGAAVSSGLAPRPDGRRRRAARGRPASRRRPTARRRRGRPCVGRRARRAAPHLLRPSAVARRPARPCTVRRHRPRARWPRRRRRRDARRATGRTRRTTPTRSRRGGPARGASAGARRCRRAAMSRAMCSANAAPGRLDVGDPSSREHRSRGERLQRVAVAPRAAPATSRWIDSASRAAIGAVPATCRRNGTTQSRRRHACRRRRRRRPRSSDDRLTDGPEVRPALAHHVRVVDVDARRRRSPRTPNAIARRWSSWVASAAPCRSAPARSCRPSASTIDARARLGQLGGEVAEAVALLAADEPDAADASSVSTPWRRRRPASARDRRCRPCRRRCRAAAPADRARPPARCARRRPCSPSRRAGRRSAASPWRLWRCRPLTSTRPPATAAMASG